MRHLSRGRAAFVAALALGVVCIPLLLPSVAWAQIYVVVDADGNQRFTTQPEPGADLFMPTRFTSRATTVGAGGELDAAIDSAATRAGLEPALVRAVVAAESAFDPDAVSHKGARGLMQLMPETAVELGVDDAWDPHENLDGGSRHLARLLRKYDDLSLALAAYNAGEGAVERHGGIPPFQETRSYVRRVLDLYRTYRRPGR